MTFLFLQSVFFPCQSLAYTAERDTSAMKVLAEVMAPYLHQRAMELRPTSSMRAGTSGAAIRAASTRPK